MSDIELLRPEAITSAMGDMVFDGDDGYEDLLADLKRQRYIAEITSLRAELEAVRVDENALRRMLAFAIAGSALYTDDGELSDSSKSPTIDFKRDPVQRIAFILGKRAGASMAAGKPT